MTLYTQDKNIRTDLAHAYRILAHLGMDDHTYTHLSSRGSGEYFYIQPFGMRFEEVTPENLLQVSFDGEVIYGDEYQCNKTGYVTHSSVYKNRGDINAVFHVHTTAITAVSACQDGLLPISQWALHFFNKVSYHDYDSLLLDFDQTGKLQTDLGDNYTMLMRNHGSVTCGRTIQEAMFYTYHLEQACKTQIAALSMGCDLIYPTRETCLKAVDDLLNFEKNLGQRDWLAWVSLIKRHSCSF